MISNSRFTVSHAPFLDYCGRFSVRNLTIMAAALVALIPGLLQYGMPAVGVVALSISTSMGWELLMNRLTKRPETIGDFNAAVIGLLFAMMVPATLPWWAVVTGTFICIVIGKMIYGGIGGNPFNPALTGLAIISISWGGFLDFDEALLNYDFDYPAMVYPLASLKHFGMGVTQKFSTWDLLIGNQLGGIGSTCGLAIIAGGLFLIVRGIIRWEISFSFLAGVYVTALLFNLVEPAKYAGPMFHLLTGYTLIGAFFLATEDSSSPVGFIPMILYGVLGGLLTVLIRNIGAYVDGVVLAIIMMNLASPLLDKIKPKTLGKVV